MSSRLDREAGGAKLGDGVSAVKGLLEDVHHGFGESHLVKNTDIVFKPVGIFVLLGAGGWCVCGFSSIG